MAAYTSGSAHLSGKCGQDCLDPCSLLSPCGTCACKPRLQPNCAEVEALPDMVPSSASWLLALQLRSALAGSQRSNANHDRNHDCKLLRLRATDTSFPRCVPAGVSAAQADRSYQSTLRNCSHLPACLCAQSVRCKSHQALAQLADNACWWSSSHSGLVHLTNAHRQCWSHSSQRHPSRGLASVTCVLAALCLSSLPPHPCTAP